jgi:hypothetical protein
MASGSLDGKLETSSDGNKKESVHSISKSASRRKRRRGAVLGEGVCGGDGEAASATNKSKNTIFNGLVFAVSACDKKPATATNAEEPCSSSENSYKAIVADCKAGGAAVTGQVHKRVHALICTKATFDRQSSTGAPLMASQRVRKALKYSLDIVDVSWVRDSIKKGLRLPYTDNSNSPSSYLLNELAREAVENSRKEKCASSSDATDDIAGKLVLDTDDSFDDANATTGWSEPVALDCCCVCHENGDEKCPWCLECNINLAKKRCKTG